MAFTAFRTGRDVKHSDGTNESEHQRRSHLGSQLHSFRQPIGNSIENLPIKSISSVSNHFNYFFKMTNPRFGYN